MLLLNKFAIMWIFEGLKYILGRFVLRSAEKHLNYIDFF